MGIELETPLLVPSFSSKGFGFKDKTETNQNDVSEVTDALEFSKEFLTESLLISAYDLFYDHIPYDESTLCTDLIIIDSGGYECGNTYDLSTVTKFNYDLKKWDLEKFMAVLDKWPQHKAGMIVSFDHGNHRLPLEEQINNANELFTKYKGMLNNFLIKPETKDQKYVQINNVLDQIKSLNTFNVIGLTERELGNSILKRMLNIYKIRQALDSEKIYVPLHIFGSLDPVTSILYYLAGAEIFDGLTWLKFAYYNSAAIYTSNFGVLHEDLGIMIKDANVKSMAIAKNTYYLDKMRYTMKDFLRLKDFSLFDNVGGLGFGAVIEKNFRTFTSNL